MEVFDPVKFSVQENEFLAQNLGKPPVVALQGALPAGCALKPIREALEQVYALTELEKHSGREWVGLEALRATIKAYIEQNVKWAAEKVANPRAPRFPSMYSYDQKGRPHWSGSGADCGQVRTYFDKLGNRIPFAVRLVGVDTPEWHPEWARADKPSDGLKLDTEASRYECRVPMGDGQFCGHTETFKPESRSSQSAARARMSKHLRQATREVDAHRELHTNEFGSAS